ncbi:2-succinyl-5-enolpyruvyl-6-hydroxy-3-cyclohexene-1-carboxylic-acid synthase [Flavobacterium ardleyense]|uniref:2-succinyl-5-enolpyruvyl-6-hydroxy-3- cyclohexene-1-carboxylic-acid synthase n=1 Tax=Flavobacterium ardleyense TaxID=2038737 RepID=UPI00298CD0DE|nr:2-succinyl-5-enolpyruvyl-6-hydroxy-3-cyclohexene-1-carboxylic-acid synthase [Flavobacterium ardleyense]
MIYPQIPLAQTVIESCRVHGITNIVISPGSRNAPLTIGFVNNPNFKCFSIVDERCAAFFAMGIAQQTKEPVAIICTSGSALLNYYPAIAEAFYSKIPLIVISADRPTEKIDIGDGQTIRQRNVFENHSLYNANLSEEASDENDLEIAKAISISKEQKGPVHINVPFEEPLYQTTEVLAVSVPNLTFESSIQLQFNFEEEIALWPEFKKKLILVGVNDPNTISEEILAKLANDPSIVVMTESTSNLHNPNFVGNIDRIITPFSEADFVNFKPDLLVTFGGMVVSKRIKQFLRKYKPQNHWHIDKIRAYDSFGALSKHIIQEPSVFFKAVLPEKASTESDYRDQMLSIKKYREEKHLDYLGKIPFSDFTAFDVILKRLPKDSQLQISNSSAIRYAQLFDIDSSIAVFCNRGTSGIDGSTSTAIGAAFAQEKQTVLITGDIGFLYDSNALWNKYIPSNFKIIIVNNGGGGIFRILPGHQETQVFNEFFETSHNLNAEHLADMYDFSYFSASDKKNLKAEIPKFYRNNDKPTILEIFTPTLINDQILLDYFKAV